MHGDDDSEELREETTTRRETLARLVPRVVFRATDRAKELGPVRELTVRDGCVVALFDSGVELQFHGSGELWSALLAKVHSGELVVAGDAEESWRAVEEAVAGWRLQ